MKYTIIADYTNTFSFNPCVCTNKLSVLISCAIPVPGAGCHMQSHTNPLMTIYVVKKNFVEFALFCERKCKPNFLFWYNCSYKYFCNCNKPL